jgi:FKBP-type peptidyl-prolyl cis-trans isomerase
MNTYKYLLFSVLTVSFLCSCNKEDKEAELSAAQKVEIEAYVAENNLTGQFNASDLWYSVEEQGGGVQAYSGATVTVVYSGYLLDGTPFDASSSSGATFSLNNVIQGWQMGIPKFKEGGNGKLIIPSLLGYGEKETGDIPANSILVFDVELLDVIN